MVPANVQPTQGATSLSKVVKSGLQNGGLECTAKVAGQQDPKPDRQNPAPHYRQPWEAFAGAADERDGGGKAHADARADVQVADEMSSNRGHWSGGAVNRAEPPGDENARGFYSLQDPLSGYAGPFWFERQLAGPDGFFRYPQSYTSNAGESENPCFSVESGAGEEMADGQESGESRGTGALKRSWEDGGSDMGGRAKRASLGSGQWASAVRDAEMQDVSTFPESMASQ